MGAKKSSPFEAEDHQKDELPSRSPPGQALAPLTPRKDARLESALQSEAPIKSIRSRTSLGSGMDLMGFQRQVVRALLACVLGLQNIPRTRGKCSVALDLADLIVKLALYCYGVLFFALDRLLDSAPASPCRGSSANLPRIASNPMNLGIPRKVPGVNMQFVEKCKSLGASSPIQR